jgi:hypothetical protein
VASVSLPTITDGRGPVSPTPGRPTTTVDRIRVDLVIAAIVLYLVGRFIVKPIATWIINRVPY